MGKSRRVVDRLNLIASNMWQVYRLLLIAFAGILGGQWIDTCCIEKRDSAELSEAINSMYRWYTEAQICYAYLEDVTWPSGSKLDNKTVDQGLPPSFLSSKWFARGWTLQELIAPPAVAFYSSEWSRIGNRETLRSTIVKLTGITDRALDGNLGGISVAQKMSVSYYYWSYHELPCIYGYIFFCS
jgi:hypothetical protein